MEEDTNLIEHDRICERNRFIRSILFTATAVSIIGFMTMVGDLLFVPWDFTGNRFLGRSLGFVIGFALAWRTIPWFWVLVPQTAALVTTNLFSRDRNPYIAYGPGAHPALPWERRTESGNITLDVLTIEYKENVATKSSQAVVDASVQLKVSLLRIRRFIGIDVAVVETGIVALLRTWLSNKLAGMTAEEARESVTRISNEMLEAFEQEKELGKRIIELYGLSIVATPLTIDLSEAVQKSRDSVEEAMANAKATAFLLGFLDDPSEKEGAQSAVQKMEKAVRNDKHPLTPQDVERARQLALASSGQSGIKVDVKRFDITGVESLGRLGPAAAAAAAAYTQSKGGDK